MIFSAVYTTGEVQEITGITHRQLTHWDETALIRPSGRSACGRGSRRLYTLLDIVQIKAIQRLRSSGVSLQKIRDAFQFLTDQSDEPAPFMELEFITDGKHVFVRRSDDQIIDTLDGQLVLRLHFSDLVAEVPKSEVGLADARLLLSSISKGEA